MKKPLWYWDSCVLLGLLKAEADKISDLEQMILDADDGKASILFSAWSFLEVLWLRGSNEPMAMTPDDEKLVQQFMMRSCFKIRNLDRKIAEDSRQLIWDCKQKDIRLSAKDAPHVATALFYNADVLHTYDPILIGLDGQLIKQDKSRLAIAVPKPQQHQFPFST